MSNTPLHLTDDEKLAELEELIETFRYARYSPNLPEHRIYVTLIASARDLRGRMATAPGEAQRELQRALDQLHASKTDLGYEAGKLRHVAETFRGKWPTVRQALERFERAKQLEEALRPFAELCKTLQEKGRWHIEAGDGFNVEHFKRARALIEGQS